MWTCSIVTLFIPVCLCSGTSMSISPYSLSLYYIQPQRYDMYYAKKAFGAKERDVITEKNCRVRNATTNCNSWSNGMKFTGNRVWLAGGWRWQPNNCTVCWRNITMPWNEFDSWIKMKFIAVGEWFLPHPHAAAAGDGEWCDDSLGNGGVWLAGGGVGDTLKTTMAFIVDVVVAYISRQSSAK